MKFSNNLYDSEVTISRSSQVIVSALACFVFRLRSNIVEIFPITLIKLPILLILVFLLTTNTILIFAKSITNSIARELRFQGHRKVTFLIFIFLVYHLSPNIDDFFPITYTISKLRFQGQVKIIISVLAFIFYLMPKSVRFLSTPRLVRELRFQDHLKVNVLLVFDRLK